jgi:hypothetical protein
MKEPLAIVALGCSQRRLGPAGSEWPPGSEPQPSATNRPEPMPARGWARSCEGGAVWGSHHAGDHLPA